MATKIEMTGASEADYLQVAEPVSRIITGFPDGLARSITLRQWEWEIYDRLQRDKGWDKNLIPVNAHELATIHSPCAAEFESILRYTFAKFIKLNFGFCSNVGPARGNDN